jgi:dolichol-phosphate mannosyltransferase
MPELSVIVPTYNERENLEPLVAALSRALAAADFELVIVDDDSRDGTAAAARAIAQANSLVRVIQRIGRRGLASAVVEGVLSTSSPYLAVIDADLQHDERILPAMLARLRDRDLDVVVASRHLDASGMAGLTRERVALSNAGRWLFHRLSRGHVSDPMSGFFVMTRAFFDEVSHSLSVIGFKVLVDLLASASRPVRLDEVGYVFRPRAHGESKLDLVVELEYLELLFHKATGGLIPPTYFVFGLVGAVGMCFNFLATAALLGRAGLTFVEAQAIGALLTVGLNFCLNNSLTFRTQRMRGLRFLTGLGLFYVVCAVALVAQLAVASAFQQYGMHWVPSTILGIVIGSVWNYTIAARLVWQVHRASSHHPSPSA